MLKIENLSVTVSGKQVLTEINLEIKKGQRLALLGPNGSGKTSLLMAIRGFLDTSIMGLPDELQKEIDKAISACEKEVF